MILHAVSFQFSFYALMKSKQKGNQLYTFGFSRFETIAAFSNSIFLIISSFFVLISTFHNLESNEHADDSLTAHEIEQHMKSSKYVLYF